jgi:hypothetical protein
MEMLARDLDIINLARAGRRIKTILESDFLPDKLKRSVYASEVIGIET